LIILDVYFRLPFDMAQCEIHCQLSATLSHRLL